MKTTVTNYYHGYEKTINHRSELPSLSALKRAFRDSKPKDCKSTTVAYRDDGRRLVIDNVGQGREIIIL